MTLYKQLANDLAVLIRQGALSLQALHTHLPGGHCLRLNYGHPWTTASERAIKALGAIVRS